MRYDEKSEDQVEVRQFPARDRLRLFTPSGDPARRGVYHAEDETPCTMPFGWSCLVYCCRTKAGPQPTHRTDMALSEAA